MGKLVESKAKGEVRDVREFEEQRTLNLKQAAQLERVLGEMISDAATVGRDAFLIARDAYAVRTILRTGLRRFEFCKLRVEDIDGDKLRVVGKGNIKDYVPLFPAAASTLTGWMELKRFKGEALNPRAFLFRGRDGGPLSFSMLRLAWKGILERAGLPDFFGLHALRHTAGLIVYGQTGDLGKTARFLRHTDMATTARYYLHVDPDALREELATIGVWQ